mmetsp:Transcript_11786/g.35778  ORF Transcript_11786/g.35778 Transcript_11786/m.35778 type:complete len:339 (-) Transcript_11786:97-1113(-)|eukprot:CAMPEP_0118881078 /NCGR_PEP_ID=MMETSP1163-20130328/20554_1 /TAXON_ID=124430 /ORGANISM="Phaeomonas parva, Strain CCMP2877" /LENGTH=338 /DNA_ID=CAMNT_0006817715 /DNA_START=92 /DNA_END=1108 /DNA_ORIENTATION=+
MADAAAAAEALRDLQEATQIPIVCPGHTREINNIKFSDDTPDGLFMVSGCSDKMPMLRHGDAFDGSAEGGASWGAGDWIGTFAGHRGAVWTTTIDPMCYVAATASADCSVKLWNATSGDETATLLHKSVVKTVDLTDDAGSCVSGGYSGKLSIWDLNRPDAAASEFSFMEDGAKVRILHALWDRSEPNFNTLLVGAENGRLKKFDVRAGGECVQEVELGAAVQDIEASKALPQLTVAAGNTVTFFDPTTLAELKSHRMKAINFRNEGGASLHPSGDRFIAGGGDLWVRVFDYETGKEMECHKGHHGPVRCTRYTPKGDHYATGSEDGTIRIWKTVSEE